MPWLGGVVTRPLVLASASPARLQLLRRSGVEPAVRPSSVDERQVERRAREADPDLTPEALVGALARAKGEAVASSLDGRKAADLVLACDSVLEVGAEVVGKPGSADLATTRWRSMRGGSGVLHTGHWLLDAETGRSVSEATSSRLRFADVSDDEIDAYVATGEPLHVAGGFTIDGFGAPFVEVVEGDPGTVIGLCLPALRRLLLALDVPWWSVADPSSPTPG